MEHVTFDGRVKLNVVELEEQRVRVFEIHDEDTGRVYAVPMSFELAASIGLRLEGRAPVISRTQDLSSLRGPRGIVDR